MHVLVTRPEEDAAPLAAKLAARGHRVTCLPLLRIVPRRTVDIPRRPWQAVLATSANGIRALSGHEELKSIRILTVGPQSLAAAHAAGFAKAEAHGGDVDGLAAFVAANLAPAAGPLLYLSGAETSGDLAGRLASLGFACHRAIVYDALPVADPEPLAKALAGADAVMLYSPRTALIWRDLVTEAGQLAEAARPTYLCLSMNVAKALPDHWSIKVAMSPDETAMLALLEETPGKR
jgi:uroporphyrinogen-III synthase